MKEIPFPDGLMPLDIFVSSVGKNRITEDVEGRDGVVDYGTDYTDRSVELSMWVNSQGITDYRFLRNELYALFDIGNAFYIAETRIPARVLKVAVDENYIPNRLTTTVAEVNINCRTLDSVFWESMYTTVDIHNLTDEQFTKQFGNVTEKPTGSQAIYRTVGEKLVEFIDISAHSFENSFVSSSDGSYSIGGRFVANPKLINIIPGIKYTFEDSGTANNLSNWWLYFYDANGEFLSSTFTSNKTLSFTPKGTKMRIMAEPSGSASFSPQDIGTILKPRLKYTSDKQVFTIYNGGNVLVEPEFMFLEITIGLLETPDVFTVKNKTTGDVFEWKKPVSGRNIYLKGMNISEGTAFNGLRETNRKFIRLAPGVNRFEVWGGTFKTITFNTKFYFK